MGVATGATWQDAPMAWDSNRPVDYRRIFRDWLLIAAAMAVLIAVVPSMRSGSSIVGLAASLVLTLPVWFGLSWLLAKFGYQRKTLSTLRAERAARDAARTTQAAAATATAGDGRPRPAPTRRTSTGHNRPQRKRR